MKFFTAPARALDLKVLAGNNPFMGRRNSKIKVEPEAFSLVLDRIMGKAGKTDLGAVWRAWERACEAAPIPATPAAFKNGVLVASVENAALCQELTYLRDDLKARINAFLGGDIVSEIRFKVGR